MFLLREGFPLDGIRSIGYPGPFSEKRLSMHKVGRNDPCPCGSGKKYKKCCEAKQTHKKFQAQVINPITTEAKDTSKVSSLFFKRASTPPPAQEPPNPVM